MNLLLSITVGVLFAASIYMILRRSVVKLIIGLVLLGHGANLLIFLSSGLVRGKPPLVPMGGSRLEGEYSDPLPAALILTAIVISFGIVSFAAVLVKRAYQEVGTDDLDEMKNTDR